MFTLVSFNRFKFLQNGSAWLKDVVSLIMQHTPHAWPSHTLQNFPPVLVDMVSETTGPKENVAQLKKSVEEEWRLVFFRQDRIICYLAHVKINTYSCSGHGVP